MRVVIADDEAIARRRLARLLSRVDGVALAGEAVDCDTTVETVRRLRPDLLLLDVQMPGGDGFSVIERLGRDTPSVIFVTAYDRYALRAFDVAAIDYLTKPVDPPRLAAALGRAQAWIAAGEGAERIAELTATVAALRAQPAEDSAAPRDLWVKSRSGYHRIPLETIDYVRAERDYARIVVEGRSHLIPETLTALSGRLGSAGFLRIHRSVLIRTEAVRKIDRRAYGALVAILPDGTELPVGRSYAAEVQLAFGLRPGKS